MDWNDLKLILTVERCQGAVTAANELGISHATISRRIAEIEQDLNLKLVDRSGLRWKVTPICRQIAEKIRQVENVTEDIRNLAEDFSRELKGNVRISVPTGAVSAFLAPALRTLRQTHPDIRLVFQTEDQLVDLPARKADIAVRFTSAPDPDLIGRKVASSAWAFYAPPSIAQQVQDQMNAGLTPNVPLLTTNPDNSFPDWAAGVFAPDSACDYILGFRDKAILAANGFGVVLLPRIIGDVHVGLERLEALGCPRQTELWILANSDVRLSHRISTVKRALEDGLKQIQHLLDPDQVAQVP